MNLALIFAGGTGTRMNSKTKPKQFLELNGKPIIIHTIELFESHPEIDAIAVVCLESWIGYLNELLERFRIKKVKYVVPGGETGQQYREQRKQPFRYRQQPANQGKEDAAHRCTDEKAHTGDAAAAYAVTEHGMLP